MDAPSARDEPGLGAGDGLAKDVAYDRSVDEHARQLVYSVTKAFLGVLCLRLELDLPRRPRTGSTTRAAAGDAAAATEPHERDPRLRPPARVRLGGSRPS